MNGAVTRESESLRRYQARNAVISRAVNSDTFAPEKNLTRLHQSYYSDPAVQERELAERERVRRMQLNTQNNPVRQAAQKDQAAQQAMYRTSDKVRKRNGARSGAAIRKNLEYLRGL